MELGQHPYSIPLQNNARSVARRAALFILSALDQQGLARCIQADFFRHFFMPSW
jgi:hypothetical protein